MPSQEKPFTARHVDEQFELVTQAASLLSDTPGQKVVESLQTLYREQTQQEQQALEQMRQRLSLAVVASQNEQQDVAGEDISVSEAINIPAKRPTVRLTRPRRRVMLFEQAIAVLLVLAIIAGWFAISHLSRSSLTAFSDASARPLGPPIANIRGNFSSLEEWSPDGRTFVFLQIDRQKRTLEMHMLDIHSGRSTIYPVLDSSWIRAFDLEDNFGILMGRYLLAERALGQHHATMVIWDIIGQRAVTTQTMPAQILGSGQVGSPWIVASENEQKLAVFASDGTVTIWDIASGRKLVTCEGKAVYSMFPVPSTFKWFNHDQSLLFLNRQNGTLDVWDVNSGKLLYNLRDASKKYIEPVVSPDNRYMALTTGQQQTTGNVTSYHPDTLEILDAHSGHELHSYPLHVSHGMAATYAWLPDSQHLLVTFTSAGNSNTSSAYPGTQTYIWNVLTGQKAFVSSLPQAELILTTPDGRYQILGGPNARSMQIWQASSGRHIATITTPGIYARSDSFFNNNNQYLIIGLKGDLDIWEIATGRLLYKYHGTTPFSIPGVDGSMVSWSPNGKYLTMIAGTSASIGDGVLSIWRMP